MSTSRPQPKHRKHSQPRRPATQRPPIQWPSRPAPPTDNQRATDYARAQVERTYLQEGEPNSHADSAPASKETKKSSAKKVIKPPQSKAAAPSEHTMRQETYDWQRYHTAWQQYYHQYFYRYYAGWWQQQRRQGSSQTPPPASQPPPSDKQAIAKELRDHVRSTVSKRAKRFRASSHFKPLVAAGLVATLFLFINYNQVLVGAIKQYLAPGSIVTTPVIVEPNTQVQVGPEPKLIIPKIGVEAPVVYDEPNVDEASYQRALERGVVRLGTTANPGTRGNVVIGGHSSNNVFNAGKYKYVFVNLKKLEVGDTFYLNYNGTRYTYKVTKKEIVPPSDVSALAPTDVPTVTLFTCDPPGTNINRLVVQAVQIDPDPNAAPTNPNQPPDTNQANPLPSVAPSLWDSIF